MTDQLPVCSRTFLPPRSKHRHESAINIVGLTPGTCSNFGKMNIDEWQIVYTRASYHHYPQISQPTITSEPMPRNFMGVGAALTIVIATTATPALISLSLFDYRISDNDAPAK